MIDFSAISYQSWLGRTLRVPLQLIPAGIKVPILQGALRGKRWIVGSGNHGCWLGTYELTKVRRVMAFLKPGMTCCDIGANVGYYTLLFSVFAGDAGKVFAFEPLPSNLEFLRHHVLTNHCGNVQVLDFAITDFNGSATFEEHESRSMGHLSASGHLNVRCATLNELLADGAIATPDILKIDVEGAELSVLVGARETLQAAKPVIFLATHGNAAHSSCCRLLNDIGYDLEPIDGKPVEYSRELLAVAR